MSESKVERMLLQSSSIKREKPAKKRLTWLALALAMSLKQTACGAGKSAVSNTPPPARASDLSNKRAEAMKIRITIGDRMLTATLNDSEAARDFASLLPLTLTLEDYNKIEKVGDLPRKLSTTGAPAGSDPSVGDIAYYAPWGNLAIYYKDFGYSDGLVILGKIDGGAEAFNAPGPLKATIELLDADESVRP